jgi:hypothetical protein
VIEEYARIKSLNECEAVDVDPDAMNNNIDESPNQPSLQQFSKRSKTLESLGMGIQLLYSCSVRTRKIFLHLRVDVFEEGAKKHIVLRHWHVHSESIDLLPPSQKSVVLVFSDIVFDRSSYSKFFNKYYLFCYDLFYH